MTSGIHQRIAENCKLLARGWSEEVEYVIPVTFVREGVTVTVNEKRTRHARRPGLLEQLLEYRQHKDTDRNPKSERGAPRVKTAGRPPGDVEGFFALDEISVEVHKFADRICAEAGLDRAYGAGRGVNEIILWLPFFAEDYPDLASDILAATGKWVRVAQQALRHTVADAMFGGTVCGNCAGALTVAWDNTGDVRCIGTPATAPCGETYPMSEWVSLYERGKTIGG